jgi:sucrose-6F-phosphate phosphohydrolase
MRHLLLCTDLDRTLIANGAQPESLGASALFSQLVSREDVTLVYVSGRHLALIEQAMTVFGLPAPDAIIADVGSTIYHATPSGWYQDAGWRSQIAPDWRGLAHEDLRRLLEVFPVLQLQPAQNQGHHKLSYHISLEANSAQLMGEMDACLKSAQIKANLIWSIDEPAGLGLLDVLPAGANKLHAIQFLMQQNGYQEGDVIFAGDSGNDLDVLLSSLPSVLVANADPQVKSQTADANPDTLYVAHGGYLGMNGNYSAGILEGVAHYRPELDAWLRARQI